MNHCINSCVFSIESSCRPDSTGTGISQYEKRTIILRITELRLSFLAVSSSQKYKNTSPHARKVFSVRKKIKENNRRAGERITLLEREKIEVPQKIKDIYQEVFEYLLDLFLSEKELFIKETKNKSTNNKEKANMSADPDDKYIEYFLRKNILIAGGFISDLIIKNETKKETKIRDIDLYISPMVLEIYDKIVREKAPNKSIGEKIGRAHV